MKYTTILWDLDGTLLNFDKSCILCLKKSAEKQKIEITEEQIKIYQKINTDYWKRLERNEITKQQLLHARFVDWVKETDINIDPIKMFEEYNKNLAKTPVLYPDTIEVLDYFHKNGFRQYIITNGNADCQEGKLNVSGIINYIDGQFISDLIGKPKPQKDFFDWCAQKIPNYNPEETVVIGDSLTSDIQGANNAGLTCIWLNKTAEQVPMDLKNIRFDFQVQTLSQIVKLFMQIN